VYTPDHDSPNAATRFKLKSTIARASHVSHADGEGIENRDGCFVWE
jgi:hypothetical protein